MTGADHRRELLLELAHRLAQREVAGRNELAEQVEDFLDILCAELLGQVRPLDLVSVGLKRQIDARHCRAIPHFWPALMMRRASAMLSSVLRGGNRLTKARLASMTAASLARTLNSVSDPTPSRQRTLLPASPATSFSGRTK